MRLIDANKAKFLIADGLDTFKVPVGDRMADRLLKTIDAIPTEEAVVLPCKPGDHVFRLCGTKRSRYVGERIVGAVTLCGNGSWTILSSTHDTLGKTVFLTRAEAEAALAKMKGLEVGA